MFGFWVDVLDLIEHWTILLHVLEVFFLNFLELLFIFKRVRIAHILKMLLLNITHNTEIFSKLTPFISFCIHQSLRNLIIWSLIELALILLELCLLLTLSLACRWWLDLFSSSCIYQNGLGVKFIIFYWLTTFFNHFFIFGINKFYWLSTVVSWSLIFNFWENCVKFFFISNWLVFS